MSSLPLTASSSASREATDLPMRVLRMLVGLFYLPHVLSKIVGFAGTVVFFGRAGFQPPEVFVVFSGILELAVGVALLLGVFTKYAALLSAGLMVVAAGAIMIGNGVGWYWNKAGVEYLVFWVVASLVVFADAWRKEPGLLGWVPGRS
jgi:putative oxidoreductase